jgi:prepilin-type N-terminal cleavage/methylation domain-containing protein
MVSRKEKGIRSSQRGFTLVECGIVVFILAIMAALAIPSFQKYSQNGNLKAAAREIISDFSSLKQRAMAENKTFSVKFDVVQNNYIIQGGGTNQVKTPKDFASDITITTASFNVGSTIKFQTRGTTSFGTVVLTNGRNSKATITTNIAGRTHVHFDFK